jgi:probable rRNA maturation factor
MTVSILTESVRWARGIPALDKKVRRWVLAAGGEGGVNILLTTDAAVRRLNRDFRGKDKPTNVLSFPQAKGSPHLGDIALAFETVKREAREQDKTLEAHTAHLVVHGVLHLQGYDHMNAKAAKRMEKLECDILGRLGYPDPYADTPGARHE